MPCPRSRCAECPFLGGGKGRDWHHLRAVSERFPPSRPRLQEDYWFMILWGVLLQEVARWLFWLLLKSVLATGPACQQSTPCFVVLISKPYGQLTPALLTPTRRSSAGRPRRASTRSRRTARSPSHARSWRLVGTESGCSLLHTCLRPTPHVHPHCVCFALPAAGLGFGISSSIIQFNIVLDATTGPGTAVSPGCTDVSFFVISGAARHGRCSSLSLHRSAFPYPSSASSLCCTASPDHALLWHAQHFLDHYHVLWT